MSRVSDIFDWDEARDPAQGKTQSKPRLPWHFLGRLDCQLLDEIADHEWATDDALRLRLGWSRVRFFVVTLRLTILGWIEARPWESRLGGLHSAYRISSRAWDTPSD